MAKDTNSTVIAQTVVRVVFPIILLTSVAFLLQGHNLPGGGFIGGVLTVTAFALMYIVFGRKFLQKKLLHSDDNSFLGGATAKYNRTLIFGLVLASSAGLGSIVLGELLPGGQFEFLTQGVWFIENVPIFDKVEIPTALFFDLGVYFVVVGALLTILSVVGRE